MLRCIGFRHLLPPTQVVLFGVLWFVAHGENQRQGPCDYYWSSVEPTVFAQDGESVEFLPPCRAPKALLLAVGLNLPAVIPGAILGPSLGYIFHRNSDIWLLVGSVPLVPFLWYWIGLWIDRRLGFVGQPPPRRRFPRILVEMTFVLSLLGLFMSAVVVGHCVFYEYHYVRDFVGGISAGGWAVLLIVVTRSILRRSGLSLPRESRV
jgi:hypothetical protein